VLATRNPRGGEAARTSRRIGGGSRAVGLVLGGLQIVGQCSAYCAPPTPPSVAHRLPWRCSASTLRAMGTMDAREVLGHGCTRCSGVGASSYGYSL
jgi:hypothetical protein